MMIDSTNVEQSGDDLDRRAARHAALGEPLRLAIVDELSCSDRSPGELARRFGIGTNLVTHHLDVLASVGLIERTPSSGDGRRRYVRLVRAPFADLRVGACRPRGEMLFLCSHNSARSQLAAALWRERTGSPARSAGTDPARRVHRGAVAAARRAGISLEGAVPQALDGIPPGAQVVTVCDLVHEELRPERTWWHWSLPDPVADGRDEAFDAVLHELDQRISALVPPQEDGR